MHLVQLILIANKKNNSFLISAVGKFFGTVALVVAVLCGNSWADEPHALPEAGGGDVIKQNDPQRLADETVRTAERWIKLGKPQEALALLHRAMKAAQASGADTTAIRFTAAQALLKMRRYVEAAAILRQLVEEYPELNRIQLDYAAA